MSARNPWIWVFLLLTGLLTTPLSSTMGQDPEGRPGRQGRGGFVRFLQQLRELDLTEEQKTRVMELVRTHRGRLRSPEFQEALASVLTGEQMEKLRKALDSTRAGKVVIHPPEGLQVFRDLPYAEVEGVPKKLLSLDVYAPSGAKTAPVLLFIHGGGWRVGDKSRTVSKGNFFTGKGFVVASINYRLSPAVQHPVHVQDVAKAVAWVRKKIGEYGGDPNRIYVMGHSAGAHLAALVAVDKRRLEPEGLELGVFKGVILLDGAGYDIPRQIEELGGNRSTQVYRTAFTDDRETWVDASPVTHAAAGKGFAPFLIFHVANREASRIQSETLAKALRESGSTALVIPAAGKTHGTINREIGVEGDEVTEAILKFLEKYGAGNIAETLKGDGSEGEEGEVKREGGEEKGEGEEGERALRRARELVRSRDRNDDGKLSREEWPKEQLKHFDRLDADEDGFVTPEELKKALE
ncbi:MAG: alpha/beta hydrolase fold domain-containing protein [Planctomycetota bacterium]|jgi:acetyl esterase/lipase